MDGSVGTFKLFSVLPNDELTVHSTAVPNLRFVGVVSQDDEKGEKQDSGGYRAVSRPVRMETAQVPDGSPDTFKRYFCG